MSSDEKKINHALRNQHTLPAHVDLGTGFEQLSHDSIVTHGRGSGEGRVTLCLRGGYRTFL